VNSYHDWRRASRYFFDSRACDLEANDLSGQCYVSGRNPDIWADERRYRDLISSIVDLTLVTESSSLLEVGCATGFLAIGLSPVIRKYTGVDVARQAIRVAQSMSLDNCSFEKCDGEDLPFENQTFDASILYDVVTNFPSIDEVRPIVEEMLRVTRKGGRVLVGSVPNEQFRDAAAEIAIEIARTTPVSSQAVPNSSRGGILNQIQRKIWRVEPGIICYNFQTEDFIQLGAQLGARTRIAPIHQLNPYAATRFNVVYEY